MSSFNGVLTALITPMRDGAIDDAALIDLVERQIAGGIDGLVPCGTTGEATTLSLAEHVHVVRTVKAAARGRVPVVAGAGANDTRKAIELTRACHEVGVDAVLHVTPYYNKPPQAGLVAHFTAIAHSAPVPVLLYNVPGRTGVDMSAETVAKLAQVPGIVGIKEATGDMHRASRIRELCGDRFALLSGDDFTILPFLAVGGHGVISVVSNVLPGVIADLCRSAREGHWERARALHERQLPLTRALFTVANPIPVKAAMAMLGRCTPEIRLPLVPLDPQSPEGKALAAELGKLGSAA
ncbi:MAG TPA: 4-hydroxy-tetrahydrodipicolinate synthase [Nannocystaceae bacterium]|nr:4-hydroxy-tetrahydrodipicolinate synthase [Nannocystaceae bacterium]